MNRKMSPAYAPPAPATSRATSCNISSDMVKDIKERFGIMLADAEVAIDPKKITDCEGWVSAELHDRYALYRDKLEKRRNAA